MLSVGLSLAQFLPVLPPEICITLWTALPSVGARNQGKAIWFPCENKEKCCVQGGLGSHTSFALVLMLESARDEALGKQIWRKGVREKLCFISQKNIIALPAPPPEAAISDPWDKSNRFLLFFLLPKLCSHSACSSVHMGSGSCLPALSSSLQLYLLTLPPPAPLLSMMCSPASCFLSFLYCLCATSLEDSSATTCSSLILSTPRLFLLLLRGEGALTGSFSRPAAYW